MDSVRDFCRVEPLGYSCCNLIGCLFSMGAAFITCIAIVRTIFYRRYANVRKVV